MTLEDVISEGDKVAGRFSWSATHLGEFAGNPPTGRRVRMTGIGIVRIVNGQMAERWNVTDELSLLQQLGMIPAPG